MERHLIPKRISPVVSNEDEASPFFIVWSGLLEKRRMINP